MYEKKGLTVFKLEYYVRHFGVENKKFGSSLRSSAQISFSELYMECLPEVVSFSKG
ncbi:MAG: hypothetical protein ACMUEL_04960 [Flavobacteriales bacterium Tduv]